MYEHITPEAIRARILTRLEEKGIQTREGSFSSDMAAGAALEIAEAYHSLDAFLPAFYLDETSGIYIDKQAASFGVYRKGGTVARCRINFTGTDGAVIPAGMPFYTAMGLVFLLEEDVTLTGSVGSGYLVAEKEGVGYNIGRGEIVSTLRNVPGVASYENEAAEGGTDAETDESLLERYHLRLQMAPTSGNPYHYQMWAREVDGIGTARVIAKWAGAGTVKVVLADPEMQPPGEEQVAAADAHIQAERPVGPAVTTVAATALTVNVAAKVTLDGTTTVSRVKELLTAMVTAYLRETAAKAYRKNIDLQDETIESGKYKVLYNRIAYLLLSIPGVVDYQTLTVGGTTENLEVAADALPVLGEVAIT